MYIAGTESTGTNYYAAVYWKNGNRVTLTDSSNAAAANAIAISGNDVYVVGYDDIIAKYWKNGNPVVLAPVSDPDPGFANGITIYGNDVYVAANEFQGSNHMALYWKNGIAVPLTVDTVNAWANSIVISNQ